MKYLKRPVMAKIDLGVRKVAPTYGRGAFVLDSHKMGGTATVESTGEQLLAQMLSIDPLVSEFKPQPFTVDLIGRRIIRSEEERRQVKKLYAGEPGPVMYTPDFGARMATGQIVALEGKLGSFEGGLDYEAKLARAADILSKLDIELMRIVLPHDRQHPIYSNIPLLHQAAKRHDLLPVEGQLANLDQLAEHASAELKVFMSQLRLGMNLAPVLIANGVLSAPIHEAFIRGNMPVEPAYGDLQHLHVFQEFRA